ncbi:hypothetical protein D3C85_1915310 [compost metagenome]
MKPSSVAKGFWLRSLAINPFLRLELARFCEAKEMVVAPVSSSPLSFSGVINFLVKPKALS